MFSDGNILPSHEQIQQTLEHFQNQHVMSSVDYFHKRKFCRCHVYTYPCKREVYSNITNNFPGGLYETVHTVSLYDERPFEHEFFFRISQAFPLMGSINCTE